MKPSQGRKTLDLPNAGFDSFPNQGLPVFGIPVEYTNLASIWLVRRIYELKLIIHTPKLVIHT